MLMAAEEQIYIYPQLSAPASDLAPPALPQYPEMILTAIEELNEKNGSNKSSISKYIESRYGNLPPAHATLLTRHLNGMKSAGQLLCIKNNYLKPDPNSPPPRGRGRPPKPKTPLPPGTVLPPRHRGRPPKFHNPSEPPKTPKPKPASSITGKKRGRPPKAKPAVAGASRGLIEIKRIV